MSSARYAWLIELHEIDEEPLYLTGFGRFSTNVNDAVRFGTKGEAEQARKQLKCGGQLSVHEHMWVD